MEDRFPVLNSGQISFHILQAKLRTFHSSTEKLDDRFLAIISEHILEGKTSGMRVGGGGGDNLFLDRFLALSSGQISFHILQAKLRTFHSSTEKWRRDSRPQLRTLHSCISGCVCVCVCVCGGGGGGGERGAIRRREGG